MEAPARWEPRKHLAARFAIRPIGQKFLEAPLQEPPRFPSQHLRKGIPFCADITLDRVRDRIHPRSRSHVFGRRSDQGWIQDRGSKPGFPISAGHFLTGLFLSDQRERLGFAPGPGRRGNPDRWQHGK